MCEYPGRSHRQSGRQEGRNRIKQRAEGSRTAVTTNCEKSAEAIIPGNREGLNNRKSEETEEGGQYGESRIPRERGLPAKG